MSQHPHILVVDDEPQITRVLRTTLSAQEYEVRVANDGEMAMEIMKDWTPQLVLTDLAMPRMDGVELCRRIRESSQLPIIVLSVRGQEQWKVKALDAGADDYVTKPFHTGELLARIRANLRRLPPSEADEEAVIETGDFRIDIAAHRVLLLGKEIRLTPKEFELLAYLARRPGRVVRHQVILSAVWGANSAHQPEYLRVFIGQLRKKLEGEGGARRYLLTEPWVGYRFEPEGL